MPCMDRHLTTWRASWRVSPGAASSMVLCSRSRGPLLARSPCLVWRAPKSARSAKSHVRKSAVAAGDARRSRSARARGKARGGGASSKCASSCRRGRAALLAQSASRTAAAPESARMTCPARLAVAAVSPRWMVRLIASRSASIAMHSRKRAPARRSVRRVSTASRRAAMAIRRCASRCAPPRS